MQVLWEIRQKPLYWMDPNEFAIYITMYYRILVLLDDENSLERPSNYSAKCHEILTLWEKIIVNTMNWLKADIGPFASSAKRVSNQM